MESLYVLSVALSDLNSFLESGQNLAWCGFHLALNEGFLDLVFTPFISIRGTKWTDKGCFSCPETAVPSLEK